MPVSPADADASILILAIRKGYTMGFKMKVLLCFFAALLPALLLYMATWNATDWMQFKQGWCQSVSGSSFLLSYLSSGCPTPVPTLPSYP